MPLGLVPFGLEAAHPAPQAGSVNKAYDLMRLPSQQGTIDIAVYGVMGSKQRRVQ